MSEQIKIEIGIEYRDGVKVFQVEGIPAEVWNQFMERSAGILPNAKKPDLAWASLLIDYIQSIGDQQTKTLIVRDIPSGYWSKFLKVLHSRGMRAINSISSLIRSAETNQLIAVHLDDAGPISIIATGLNEKSIGPIVAIAKESKLNISDALQGILEEWERSDPEKGIAAQVDGVVGSFQ